MGIRMVTDTGEPSSGKGQLKGMPSQSHAKELVTWLLPLMYWVPQLILLCWGLDLAGATTQLCSALRLLLWVTSSRFKVSGG